jgi:hypothetical protein
MLADPLIFVRGAGYHWQESVDYAPFGTGLTTGVQPISRELA